MQDKGVSAYFFLSDDTQDEIGRGEDPGSGEERERVHFSEDL